MARLRVIGDCHGKFDSYYDIVKDANKKGLHTLQIGDFGFSDSWRRYISLVDTKINKIMLGNHDNYSLRHYHRCLDIGDWGWYRINWQEFFFVRGAFSLDYKQRTIGIDYFPEEELPSSEHDKIINAFAQQKPSLVFTHDCPHSIGEGTPLKPDDVLLKFGYNPATFSTRTQILLQKMWEAHRPDLWIFGHFHKNWQKQYGNTIFRCLAELSYIDL